MMEATKKHQVATKKQKVERTRVWKESEYSSYYDYKMDTQCYVPTEQSAEDILASLELEI